jgi:hypothetical protein
MQNRIQGRNVIWKTMKILLDRIYYTFLKNSSNMPRFKVSIILIATATSWELISNAASDEPEMLVKWWD